MKVLFLDIETRPAKVYVWSLFNQNINIEQVIEPSALLCFSAKWQGDKGTLFYSDRKDGHEKMVRKAYDLFNEADVIVQYNGNSFDIPILNQEFLLLGLTPPAPSASVDLYRVIQQKFRALSNKLAFIGPYLKIGEKVKHEGFDLWLGCMENDPKAWATMEKYNRQDTALMEPLYQKLLPWIDKHPNRGMFEAGGCDKPNCPNCGSTNVTWKGLRRATTYTYQRFVCNNCGKWSRGRQSIRTEEKPKLIGI